MCKKLPRHFPRPDDSGGEQAGVGGARHKEVSGLQCLWAEAQSSAKVSRLLPLDQRQPKVTIPEEEELSREWIRERVEMGLGRDFDESY